MTDLELDPRPALLALDAAIRHLDNVQTIRLLDADLDGPDPHVTAAVRLRPNAQRVNIRITPSPTG